MTEKKPWLYVILKAITCSIIRVLYRPEIINKEYIPKDGAFIVCGNHRHAFDPFLTAMSTNRMIHFLAKIELFKFPLGSIFRGIGAVPVDRSKRDKNATDKAQEYLLAGNALCLFPEGTRNKTGDILLPFKFGAVSLAQKTNTDIVPFAIIGKFRIFGKHVVVKFGKPINVTNMNIEEANEYLKKTIKNLLGSQ